MVLITKLDIVWFVIGKWNLFTVNFMLFDDEL